MIFRKQKEILEQRLSEKSPLIQVIIGPRQVGKTTLIKQASPDALYFSADSPVPLDWSVIEELWTRAQKSTCRTLVIDEVQKIQNWSNEIKRLWDKEKNKNPIKLVLSGSAALSIEKNLKESLAGRFEIIYIPHWSYKEANECFHVNLRNYIEFGCYPGSMSFLKDDTVRWSSYLKDSIIEPVIGRDILLLHPVSNPTLLRQLFGICLSYPAQIVSLGKLQGNIQVSGALKTLQTYLSLLEQSFLISPIYKYSKSTIQIRKSKPKIIINDNALMRCFHVPVKEKISDEKFGRYFENSIIARLIEKKWSVFYWNDRELEVDAVALGPNGEKWAIEIKSSSFDNRNFSGLKKFCSIYPEFSPKLISFISQVHTVDFLEVIEVDQFFDMIEN